jgi:predicted RNA-binding protein
MCETNAYVYRDGSEELYLDNVDTIRPEGEGLVLRNLFGEERRFEGRIREIALMKHKIVLEGAARSERRG